MPSLNQDNRLLRIDTPLGKDIFVAVKLHGEETSSALFQFYIELLSTEFEIKPEDMVGQKVTASIHYNKEHTRFINGVVSQFSAHTVVDDVRIYSATIVPTMWLLTLSQSSNIFVGKTTKDIVSDILKNAGVDFTYSASVNDKREYCIQYQETDFEFVTRLLAEEGLSYFFTHDDGEHKLLIVDKNNQYIDCGEKQVECEEENADAATQTSRVTQWRRQYQMHTGKLAMTGYLESAAGKGQNSMVNTRNKILKNLNKFQRDFHESSVPYRFKKELPDYGASITQKKTAELILEAEEAGYDTARGSGNCCTFFAGGRFELKHRLESESGKYLITRVSHQVISSNNASDYSNSFSCVPATTLIHLTPPANRLRINGPQLATVIEVKAGDSAGATDPQLMVKVRFYWDEKQQSCWVRVMQNFAGALGGAIFVPRVDSEVVVEFIGGDPDRPLITGAVYNSDNVAPQYSKTQSGFKTGGNCFNEFRFDDKSSEEEIYLKAGKDFNYLVVNDETGEVQNNQTLTVKGAHELKVTGSSTYTSDDVITIEAATSITLKVGSNKIVIDNSGISMKGTVIKGKADANLELKAGAMADVKASGILNLKGSVTKIN